MKLTAKEIILKEYGASTNFMTPTIIEYGLLPNGAYELSEGEFLDKKLYGVTVVSATPGEIGIDTNKEYDLSGSFDSIEEARDYISRLRKGDE